MYIESDAAIMIYYFMIAVDGEVKQIEMEKFIEIVKETDRYLADDEKKLNELIEKCKGQLEKAIDEEEYYEVIKEGIDEITNKNVYTWEAYGSVKASLLLWNLLSIATSDKEYSAEEQKLIRYIVRKLNIQKDIYLEMENAMKAIEDINKETDWLKRSNKPYVVIESMIGELSERQTVVFESIKTLIADKQEV